MNAIVNVCGPAYSGSTIMTLMLAHGNHAYACGEIGKWYRLARYRKDSHLDAPLDQIETVADREFHSRVCDLLQVNYVIDSSKGIDWIIDTHYWAKENGLNVFNVVQWKHPVDHAYSRWKRNSFDEWYDDYVRYYTNLIEWSGIDFISVNYDDLVERPSDILYRVCQHTGIPYFEGKENFWKENHSFAGGNEGVRDQLETSDVSIRRGMRKPEFKPYEAEVDQAMQTQSALRDIVGILESRDVSVLPLPTSPISHDYRPTATQYLWYLARRTAVPPVKRLRWNIVEPWIIEPMRAARRRLLSDPA